MPKFSIASVVFLMPAVSIKRNVMLFISIVSSITSRVVPCMLLTIAFSSFSRQFSRVLLPTFVFPTIATDTPFFMARPVSKEVANELIFLSICLDN